MFFFTFSVHANINNNNNNNIDCFSLFTELTLSVAKKTPIQSQTLARFKPTLSVLFLNPSCISRYAFSLVSPGPSYIHVPSSILPLGFQYTKIIIVEIKSKKLKRLQVKNRGK